VQNIEARYTSGGGTPDQLPGSNTRRGSHENTEANVEKQKLEPNERKKEQAAG
jgi:hypothetical protein